MSLTGCKGFYIIIILAVHTTWEVKNMEKNEKNKKSTKPEEKPDKKPETFHNHWETGKFLGPNTLRYEENRKAYEEEE